uniref:Uncharacterized protein n=1 Tax=Streptomyces sp. NBC_00003 TaxID=2903608 RepID=A0AAU2UWA3_9ACTN
MTTPSSSPLPGRPGIPPLPSADPSLPTEDAGAVAGAPGLSYSDPIDGLVHAAVADRPLEEVVQLITLLEQSPEYARATVDALHAVGVGRSVEDVSRLVALLTQPPRSADSADEAIRAAAECRPVEEVTRLMALLHRPPMEPHCGEEAIRAAATSRPVEDLVQLIGRLAQDKQAEVRKPGSEASGLASASADTDADLLFAESAGDLAFASGESVDVGFSAAPGEPYVSLPADARRGRAQVQGGTPRAWPRWLAALALFVCSLAYFPLHRDGASLSSSALDLGVSGLCFLVGVALVATGRPLVLAAAVLVPSALAVVQLLEGQFHSRTLTRALEITAAPSWAAGLAAALAALPALMAVLAHIASAQPERHPRPEPRPVVEEQPAR